MVVQAAVRTRLILFLNIFGAFFTLILIVWRISPHTVEVFPFSLYSPQRERARELIGHES
jgi:hypothetical protein